MTLAEQLAGYGFSADDAATRAAVVEEVAHGLEMLAGAPPEWCWFVPGRLEVFGKHTDYAGGQALVAAAPRGFAVAARSRDDQRVRVVDHVNGSLLDIAVTSDAPPLRGWAGYIDVTVRRLARNFPGAELGLDLVFASDLPRAAGMSSSSALVVAVATALAARARLDERPEWRDAVKGVEDRATYFGCIESGQPFRALAGTSGVGTQGGSEDHTAILGCRAGHLAHYRFLPTARLADIACPPGWTFVVATSGVHADKAGSVRERYNRAALAARALLNVWNSAAPEPAASLAALIADGDAVTELRRLIATAVIPAASPVELARRLDHFLAENAIVAAAAAACARGDAGTMGELAAASQGHAERLLENQVPETSTLAALARECGAHGATSFGAGFGGSVWALVDRGDAGHFARTWLDAYRRRHPGMPNVRWFTVTPGPGLVALPAAL
ncbi:MAG: galactokinase family protein [Vicinamibacterales bacterium]